MRDGPFYAVLEAMALGVRQFLTYEQVLLCLFANLQDDRHGDCAQDVAWLAVSLGAEAPGYARCGKRGSAAYRSHVQLP